jgi:hypothetical protein
MPTLAIYAATPNLISDRLLELRGLSYHPRGGLIHVLARVAFDWMLPLDVF